MKRTVQTVFPPFSPERLWKPKPDPRASIAPLHIHTLSRALHDNIWGKGIEDGGKGVDAARIPRRND